jgi:hypothetical protein
VVSHVPSCGPILARSIALYVEEPLPASAVPNTLAPGLNHTVQLGVADELLRPDLLAQLLFGGDAVALHQQVGEDMEDFAPQPDDPPSPTQHLASRVELTVPKDIDHGGNLSAVCPWTDSIVTRIGISHGAASVSGHDFPLITAGPRQVGTQATEATSV